MDQHRDALIQRLRDAVAKPEAHGLLLAEFRQDAQIRAPPKRLRDPPGGRLQRARIQPAPFRAIAQTLRDPHRWPVIAQNPQIHIAGAIRSGRRIDLHGAHDTQPLGLQLSGQRRQQPVSGTGFSILQRETSQHGHALSGGRRIGRLAESTSCPLA